MKINSIEIERFGIWSGLNISKLFDGVNVFYGANEAGKSTIMEFMRTAFYGFDTERRQYARRICGQNSISAEVSVDQNGNPIYVVSGGSLNLESAGGTYNLRRMFHPDPNDNYETIDLKNSNGEKEGTQLLRMLISGIDEQTFNNVFAIGLDEIQRIGTLNNTDAAEMLFQLSVGMERVSIVDTIKELTNRRNRILNPIENEGKPSLLSKLINERKKILETIDASKILVREYVRTKDELKVIDRSVTILEDDIAVLEREKRLYEIAKLTEPIWIKRNKIRGEIDAMGNIGVVSDDIIQNLDKLENSLTENRKKLQDIKTEYSLVHEEIKSQSVNELLIKFAPRLEILLEEESHIIEIDSQITSIEKDIQSITSRITDEDNLIKRGRRTSSAVPPAISAFAYPEERPLITNSNNSTNSTDTENETNVSHPQNLPLSLQPQNNIFSGYRTASRIVAKAKRRLHRIKERHTEILGRTKALNGKLKPEYSVRNVNTISEALDKTKDLLAALKRRQTIDQHLAETSLVHRDLHRANAILVQSQSMSTLQVTIVGLFGVIGMIPAGLAIFETIGVRAFDFGIHPVLVLGGLLLSGSAVAYKFISEKSIAGKLKQNQRQLNGLISQINRQKQEAAEIDLRFPDIVVSSIDSQRRQFQAELQSLEKLLPLESQYQESAVELKKFELRLQRSKELQAAAMNRWQEWLRSVGLPEDWSPARVRELVEHSDTAHNLRRDLERLRLNLDQKLRDLRTITERIDRIINELGLNFDDGISYIDILRNIKSMLDTNNIAIKNREKLKLDLRPLKKKRRETISNLRESKLAVSDLIRQCRVKNTDEIRKLHKLHQTRRKLVYQEQCLQREIDAAIGNFCSENVIGDILEPRIAKNLRDKIVQAEIKKDAGIEIVDNNLENNKTNNNDNDYDYDNDTEIKISDIKNVDEINYSNIGSGEIAIGEKTDEEKLLTIDQLLLLVSDRIEGQAAKLRGEIEARGKLLEQLKLLAEDQTFYLKRRELAVIDERIQMIKKDWQAYSVCCLMLDLIRESYERERQPKTLAEASELLKKLTEGKYVRIWVPLGERTLMIDDALGNTCDIGWISRGTRELLFIALRLALATAFAQHGSVMPIILDDVLVNFDTKRAKAMAKLLIEYANSGRQIFIFTCHEHVCRIFQNLDIAVRILPPAENPTIAEKVLLPKSILKERELNRRLEIQRMAKIQLEEKIQKELAKREDQIRIEEARKAEVQRMILQMQQQATAAITVEQDRKELKV
ncbi:MAG: AAA family ATPase [Planctomycetaceae bacterium]|jgi:uncharacterized protein YhaN|nr:AAA family ATPase [Planctomycetaceae bacterium]